MTNPLQQQPAALPRVERIRHELKRRSLTVDSVERVTPAMLRIHLSGSDLQDFVSLAPDDHIKIFVPGTSGEPERRDYTPRRYDNSAQSLAIDFAVHDAGPATLWALSAKPGDTLDVGGPRGSAVVSGDIAHWLLIGDETALPAIGRRIEEAKSGTRITSVVTVTDVSEEQRFDTKAELTARWVHRPLSQAADATALLAVLTSLSLQPQTFVWIAAEATVTRAVRAHLVEERGHPLTWTKSSGYWVFGKADAQEKFD